MAIDPESINTLRTGQLPPLAFTLASKIAHEVGTDLNYGTVEQLAETISAYIGATDSIAFNPVTVLDGQTLPDTTVAEWILVGIGTFTNVNGGANLTTTEELNALISNGTTWSVGVEIPITVDPVLIGISQTVNSGVTDFAPSEDAVKTYVDERIFLNAVGTFHYADSASLITPQVIAASTPEKIENDGLGDYTNVSNAPYGVSSLYNIITGQLDFSELSIGDDIIFSPDLLITTSTGNQTLRVYLKMAIGSGEEWEKPLYQIEKKTSGDMVTGYVAAFDISEIATKNYPAELWIETDASADVVNNGYYFKVTRKNINIVLVANDDTKEDVANKQDSLAIDGTGTKYPTVDAVNDEFDLIESQINPNTYVFVENGYSQVGQDITINADWEWKISNVDYTNPAPVVINIPLATAGYSRIDLIVLNESNTAVRLAGVESNTVPVAPTLIMNVIQILFLVTDSVSTAPTTPIGKNQVSQQLRNGETKFAPSENVVFDALAGKQNQLTAGTNITIDVTDPLAPIINATPGAGSTDLGYTASPTDGTVTSSTGADATVPLADGTNAGLLKPAKYTVLENTSGTNTGDQDLSSYLTSSTAATTYTLKAIQVTAQTLTAGSWTLVSGTYEYDLANANITTTSIVDIIPDNAYTSIVQVAEVYPKTLSGSGTVKLYAKNLPTGNIIVTINIWK